MEYYSAVRSIRKVASKCVELEKIIMIEVTQNQKYK